MLDDCDVTDDVCITLLVAPSADQFVSRNIQNPARTLLDKGSKVIPVAATQSCRCSQSSTITYINSYIST